MSLLLPLLLSMLVDQAADSDLRVVELFRADTPEDLRSALADGYPMPWLAEVLADTTIPEEDRYWLDCRMRAVIAQDLHMFYDRSGKPVFLQADWIAPGEEYWRECFMVDLLGSAGGPSFNRPTQMTDEPGPILNAYGEPVGRLAVVSRLVSLSRDASLGAVQSGGNEDRESAWTRQPYACLLYPDGSFFEESLDSLGQYRTAVDDDGSRASFICTDWYPSPGTAGQGGEAVSQAIVDCLVLDRTGHVESRITPPGPFWNIGRPQMTPDGAYLVCSVDVGIGIFDCARGDLLGLIGPAEGGWDVNIFRLSPGGEFLCLGGHSTGRIISLRTFEEVWAGDEIREGDALCSFITCSNDADVIAQTMRKTDQAGRYEQGIYLDGIGLVYSAVVSSPGLTEMVVSPEGSFIIQQPYGQFHVSETSLPTAVLMLVDED